MTRCVFCIFLVSALFVTARSATAADLASSGVRVLSIDPASIGEAADIRPGDILLRWSQGSASGTLPSILELSLVYRERWPLGALVIEGLRGGQPISWTLAGNSASPTHSYGLHVESAFPALKQRMDEAEELVRRGATAAAVRYCKAESSGLTLEDGTRAVFFYQVASALGSSGHFDEADDLFAGALAAAPLTLPYLKPLIRRDWARIHFNQNDTIRAIQDEQQAADEWERAGPWPLNLATEWRLLGVYHARISEWGRSVELQKRAADLTLSVAPKHEVSAIALQNLATAYAQARQYPEAENCIRQGIEIMHGVTIKGHTRGFLYYTYASLSQQQERFVEADNYYARALDEIKDAPEQAELASSIRENLGDIALARHNLPRAGYYFSQAAEYFSKAGSGRRRDLGRVLGSLAEVKLMAGDLEQAAKLSEESIEIQERAAPKSPDMIESLAANGTILMELEDWPDAEKVYQQALTLAESVDPRSDDTGLCYRKLGQIHVRQGKLEQARTDCDKAAEIDQGGQRANYSADLFCLAIVAEHKHENVLAIHYFSDGLAELDKLTGNLGRADSISSQNLYANYPSEFSWLLFKEGQAARGFQVLDRSRAKTLSVTLTESRVNLQQGIPPALVEEERKVETRLAELSDQRLQLIAQKDSPKIVAIERQIAGAIAQKDMLENRMRAASPRYDSMTGKRQISLAQIQQLLEPETLLLEYALNGKNSFVVAVDRTHISFHSLPEERDLENLTKAVYAKWSVRSGSGTQANGDAEKLSKSILSPVADLLRSKRRLIVVADGALQYVPFAALPTPWIAAEPLAANLEVVNLPSASVLALLRRHSQETVRPAPSVAILSDPVFAKDDPRVSLRAAADGKTVGTSRSGDEAAEDKDEDIESSAESIDAEARGMRFARLLHSREEAEAIASVTPKEHLVMALDFDANRSAALRPEVTNSRIVHFATHGVFDAQNPALSGLVFSVVDKRGKPQPGFLGLDAIYSSHFSSDLVVLSACETALGKQTNGEGLVGLTWGFIYAGARSVVASLWKVDDASTAELMRLFYDGMEQRNLSPATALREAQLSLSKEPRWSSPYFWAGFIIEGDYAR